MLTIIGGSGPAWLSELAITNRRVVRMPYGLTSNPILSGRLGEFGIAFLIRHGFGHTIAPHEISYRANIWALHSIGAENIIAVSAVTSINREFENGSLAILCDLIDYTYGCKNAFSEGQEQAAVRAGSVCPYSAKLHAALLEHVGNHGAYVYSEAVYSYTRSPHLVTHAEMRRYRNDGVDISGTTRMSEAVLARELSIGYARFCGIIGMNCITNNDNGRPDFCQAESHQAVEKIHRLLIGLQDQLCPTP